MTTLNQRTKFSDRLYFNQYKHCLRLDIPYVESLRRLDHSHIDHLLDLWDLHSYFIKNVNPGGSWKRTPREIPPFDLKEKLHLLLDWLLDHSHEIKCQFQRNKVFLYSNNLDTLKEIAGKDIAISMKYSEVIVDRPADTVKSRYPGYTLRVYFKSTNIAGKDKKNLIKFIDNNSYQIRLNIGLERFVTNNSTRLRDYFFIDLVDDLLLSILELMCPGVVRKTMDIIYDDK